MCNIGVVFRLKFVISQISLSRSFDKLTMVPVHNLYVIRTPKTHNDNIHSKPWLISQIKITSHAPVDDIFVDFVFDSDPEERGEAAEGWGPELVDVVEDFVGEWQQIF